MKKVYVLKSYLYGQNKIEGIFSNNNKLIDFVYNDILSSIKNSNTTYKGKIDIVLHFNNKNISADIILEESIYNHLKGIKECIKTYTFEEIAIDDNIDKLYSISSEVCSELNILTMLLSKEQVEVDNYIINDTINILKYNNYRGPVTVNVVKISKDCYKCITNTYIDNNNLYYHVNEHDIL